MIYKTLIKPTRMQKSNSYIIASMKKWHLSAYRSISRDLPGEWYLIEDPDRLTAEHLQEINPKYIFFPHWSMKVPKAIVDMYECVCFHETDLPFGRGGSPIQNLIERGIETTQVTALQMTDEIDAGPVYAKRPLSLNGLAEEIFIRSAEIIALMIKEIVINEPQPSSQSGEITIFKRRTPDQSVVSEQIQSLKQLYDFIRMLDAEGYPAAKLRFNKFEIEFKQPALRLDRIDVIATIKEVDL